MQPSHPGTPTMPSRSLRPRVSARDLELLRHLADGLSTAQSAAAMSITTNTVRTRVRRLQRKLSVGGRDQIIDCARQLQLI